MFYLGIRENLKKELVVGVMNMFSVFYIFLVLFLN